MLKLISVKRIQKFYTRIDTSQRESKFRYENQHQSTGIKIPTSEPISATEQHNFNTKTDWVLEFSNTISATEQHNFSIGILISQSVMLEFSILIVELILNLWYKNCNITVSFINLLTYPDSFFSSCYFLKFEYHKSIISLQLRSQIHILHLNLIHAIQPWKSHISLYRTTSRLENFNQESMFNTENERNEKLYPRIMLTLQAEPLTAILVSPNPLHLLNPLFS